MDLRRLRFTGVTLPEANSLPLKMDGWNTTFLLGRPIFRGYVSFRRVYNRLSTSAGATPEGFPPKKTNIHQKFAPITPESVPEKNVLAWNGGWTMQNTYLQRTKKRSCLFKFTGWDGCILDQSQVFTVVFFWNHPFHPKIKYGLYFLCSHHSCIHPFHQLPRSYKWTKANCSASALVNKNGGNCELQSDL